MILLSKSILDPSNLYVFSASDCPSNGSETDLFQNIVESTSLLDPFEQVFDIVKSSAIGAKLELSIAEEHIKPLYQIIRHGLCFDWVMNYTMKMILTYLPDDSPFIIFKGTQPFIDMFENDPIFNNELLNIAGEVTKLINWVVGDKPLNYLKNIDIDDDVTMIRSKYVVCLVSMLKHGIGNYKREYWTNRMVEIYNEHPQYEHQVIITGSHFRAFALGNLDHTFPKWHLLENGIKVSGTYRTQRKEFIRAFPDEMTFVRFIDGAMAVDETYFPMISIDDQPYISALNFTNNHQSINLDVPSTLKIKYKFIQNIDQPKQIKLRAGENCVIKDELITLDENGIGTTQIVFKSTTVSFKISDPDKLYPFAFYSTNKLQGNSSKFEWLN